MEFLFLLDVDGTLCESQQLVDESMKEVLRAVSELTGGHVGVVSGSDEAKVLRQFGVTRKEELVGCGIRYCLFENGVQAYDVVSGETLHEGSILDFLGESRYQTLVNFCLAELAQITLPVKRDGMIETRRGNINVSPVGRQCSYEERIAFNEYDKQHQVRAALARKINERFGDEYGISCRLGGQISVDICPIEWTKRYVLTSNVLGKKFHLHTRETKAAFEECAGDAKCAIPVFFGDNCGPRGNDEPLYSVCLVRSWVKSVADTKVQLLSRAAVIAKDRQAGAQEIVSSDECCVRDEACTFH